MLFPEIGNGGYNATRYVIDLNYDPATNGFLSGTQTAMTARATKDLSQLSLDFEGLTVTSVRVAGELATFNRVAPAACSPSPPATECAETKLIVNPAEPIADDEFFTVRVFYNGTPQEHTDPDSSVEGWIRACSTAGNPATCDGAFVVNQPIGAMTWFPSNNYPTDKALFDTAVTVPSTHKAIGVGELESQTNNGDGTTTWTWTEDDPTATYLTTATVGLFNLTTTSMSEDTTSQSLPVYTAIDSGCSPANIAASTLALSETPQIINFFNDYYGTYPFDSTGAVVDRTTGIGYALEVQTKPHYPSCTSALRPTIVHELAHQWFGNTATLATWSDIWFNEGWAQWSDWFHSAPGTATPAVAEASWQTEYNDGDDAKWEIAPAVLDGDPANLFAHFPTYVRGAMTIEGYRQIVGDTKFFEFAQELTTRFRYGNVTTQQVIALALEISDFTGPEAPSSRSISTSGSTESPAQRSPPLASVVMVGCRFRRGAVSVIRCMATPSQANRIAGCRCSPRLLDDRARRRSRGGVRRAAHDDGGRARAVAGAARAEGDDVGQLRRRSADRLHPDDGVSARARRRRRLRRLRRPRPSRPRPFERVLGDDILTYLLALLAAFLTAAALQRVLLGRYGGSGSDGEELPGWIGRSSSSSRAIHALIAQLEKGLAPQGAVKRRSPRGATGRPSRAPRPRVHAERLAREAFRAQGPQA